MKDAKEDYLKAKRAGAWPGRIFERAVYHSKGIFQIEGLWRGLVPMKIQEKMITGRLLVQSEL
jgi:hypothetical protein